MKDSTPSGSEPAEEMKLAARRFATMELELYFDTDRSVFVFLWSSPGKATVAEYKAADLLGRR